MFFPLSIHPWKGLRLQAGPGFISDNGGEDFAWRFGIGYRFKLGDTAISLSPEFDADLVDFQDPVYIWGLRIGYSF
jgi:hypothetical protein